MIPIKSLRTAWAATAFMTLACATRQPSPTVKPAVEPAEPTTMAETPTANVPAPVSPLTPKRTNWTFAYTPGTYTYAVLTRGTVTQLPDSTVRTIEPSTQRLVLLVTDSGTTQVLEPVTPSTIGCTPIRALLTRAQRLLPHIPSQLVAGTVWTDSATVDGCYGFLPATSTVVYRYTVVGDTLFSGTPALLITRAGVFSAQGEGNEGQHRVLLAAQGTELSQLFFNSDSGQFLGSLGDQRTQLDITTSGRLTHFIQETHETVTRQ